MARSKIKVKVKSSSKAKIQRELRRAITKNLTCPNCGHNMPTTSMGTSTCRYCGFKLKMN